MATKDHLINLKSNAINELKTETKLLKLWLRDGKVTYTSGNKLSFVAMEKRSSKEFFKLKSKLYSLMDYLKRHLNINRVYGYELTVNPPKLRYSEVSNLNRKIIRRLKSNAHVKAIQKAVEDTFVHCDINVHLHYLIMSTKPLNQRTLNNYSKRYGREVTNSITSVNIRRVTNWKKAISYITKQQGLPLPLKHRKLSDGSKSRSSQFQEFQRLPKSKQKKLIARWFNNSKGLERHRLYFNTKVANEWHKRDVARHYCIKHCVLVKTDQNTTENGRVTALSEPFDKVCKNMKKRPSKAMSRHHYSEIEALSSFYGHGVYGIEHEPTKVKSMSLF